MTLNNAFVYRNGKTEQQNYELSVGGVGFLSDFNNVYIFPAFCDVHVHFREPARGERACFYCFFVKNRLACRGARRLYRRLHNAEPKPRAR